MDSKRTSAIKRLKNRIKDLLDKCSASKLVEIANKEGIKVPAILEENKDKSSAS